MERVQDSIPRTEKRSSGRQSLRTNIAIGVIAFVLFVATVISIGAAALIERGMKPTLGRQEYDLLRSAAVHLDSQLAQREDELEALGQVLLPSLPGDRTLLREQLLSHKRLTRNFSNVGIINANGDVLADLNGPIERRINIANRPHFQEAMRTGKPVISQPLKSVLSGKPTVVVNVPIVLSGIVRYVLVGGIDLNSKSLLEPLQSATLGETGYFYLMTSKGILISHPEPERLLHDVRENPGVSAAAERALQGFEGWMEAANRNGKLGIYSITRLNNVDWILVGRHPTEEAFAPIISLRTHATVAALLFAVMAGLIVWLLARRFIGPLERLRGTVEAIEGGSASAAMLQSSRPDEIGDLSNQFYRLVTAQEASEQNARENESFIRALIQQAPDAVVCWDLQGLITEWNLQAETMFGWCPDEAIGTNIAGLIIPEHLRDQHLAHAFADSGTRPLIRGPVRLPGLRKDGTQLQIELSLTAIPAGMDTISIAFLRDVTVHIEREERLATSERRLQMVADSMPALIAYIDREERFRFTNAYCKKSLGIEPDSMLGKTVNEVLGDEIYGRLKENIAIALAGKPVHFEVSRDDPERTAHFMTDFIPDVQVNGEVHGFYTLVMDISERKEAELRQATSEQRADAANRAKSAFVANVSHEIRTPMNAVLGIAQLLRNTPLRDDQREYLDIIQTSGVSLIAILNDVLDFSKIEAAKLVFERERFDIESVVDAAAALLKANCGEREIDVAIGVGAAVPRFIMGDSYRIQQIIANLISNAVKFTLDGYVTLEFDVIERNGQQMLRLVVADSGIGISAEQNEQIFQSFSQADTSTTRKFGGTGLGLAITKRLVEMMEGEIELFSIPGVGSKFTVVLPLEIATDLPSLVSVPEHFVLLVDATSSTRDLFVRSAAFCGIPALAYESETAAANAALAGNFSMTAVTSVLLGFQEWTRSQDICPVLRQHGLLEDTNVVIVCTPFERRTLHAAAIATGPQVITKPITPKVLRHSVIRRLNDIPAIVSSTLHPGVARMRVLLVEDNPINQVVAKGMIGQVVHSIDIAHNGAEAIAKLREAPAAFDIIFMDIQMPVMDGFAATRAIREELEITVPIVAMTAGAMQQERRMCEQSGMNDFLAKPVIMDDLYVVLNRYANSTGAAQAVIHERVDDADVAVFSPTTLNTIIRLAPSHRDVIKTVCDGIARARGELQEVESALLNGDCSRALEVLHSMRGGFGTLGARRFIQVALRVERNIRRRGTHAPAELAELSKEFSLAINEFNDWVSETEKAMSLPSGGAPAARVTIAQFKEMLDKQDIKACQAFEALYSALDLNFSKSKLADMTSAMSALRFEEVVQLLREIDS
jgi:PAS domain S-box-containing protein